MFSIMPLVIRHEMFDILPFHLIGMVWFIVGIGLVVYRGKASGYWPMVDFPVKGSVIDLHIDKITMSPMRLFKSRIEGLLRSKDGTKYYRDHARSALFSGGHEMRISKDGVNHVLDINDVILTQKINSMGITSIKEMDEEIKKQMITMKTLDKDGEETDKYLLTGTTIPVEYIDVEDNPMHKQVYDTLAHQASIVLADGGTVTFYQYNNFQKALGSSTDMASVIDYVRSDEAAKATKIKKAMGMSTGLIIGIVVVVVIVIIVAAFFFMGGSPPGM